MRDKRRDAARKHAPPLESAVSAAASAAAAPAGDLGTLVFAPGGEQWAPDFTADGESRLLDLIDVDTTWDPRSLAGATQETRVLCVASDGATAGTGVAIAQIARTLARAGRDVLVVDASVAKPFLTKPFHYQPDEGLVDMVLFGTSPGAAIRKTASERIRVLTVGSPPIEAEEVWSAKELADVLTAFRAEWDAIVVHAPLRRGDGDWCDVLRLADALLVVRPAARADAAEVAKELAGLGASPRLLGVVSTGRRGEVKPEPARKPLPAPAAAPAPAPAPTAVEDARPAAAGAPAERGGEPPAPVERAPKSEPPPAREPDRSAPPLAADKVGPDFDGASGEAAPLDDLARGEGRDAGRRGPSRLLVVAVLLGVVALAGGAALGRFGGLKFGAGSAGETARPVTPPRREPGVASAPPPSVAPPGSDAATSPAATAASQGAGDERRVAPAENIGDHPVSTDAETPRIALADSAAATSTPPPPAPAAPRDTLVAGPDAGAGAIAGTTADTTAGAAPGAAPNTTHSVTTTPAVASSAASVPDVWGVHVSSFPHREMAARDSVAWRRKGYAVHVVAKEIPEKGLWYRIVLGDFAAKAEAQAFAEDVRAREGLDYGLVMQIPAR